MFQHPDGQVSASKTFTKMGYSRTRQVMENLSSRIQGVDRHVFLRNSNPIRNRPKIYNAEHYRTRSDPIELATPRFARANTDHHCYPGNDKPQTNESSFVSRASTCQDQGKNPTTTHRRTNQTGITSNPRESDLGAALRSGHGAIPEQGTAGANSFEDPHASHWEILSRCEMGIKGSKGEIGGRERETQRNRERERERIWRRQPGAVPLKVVIFHILIVSQSV